MALPTADFDFVRRLVRQESAIVLEQGKEYLVETRLQRLAHAAGEESLSAYLASIRHSGDRRAREAIVDALTTNETSWFRDGDPFTAFSSTLLPQVVEARGTERLVRIWSAACSSGQEPYSIAMLLADHLPTHGWRTEILATDLSETMIERAAKGRYSQLEVNRGLPAALLVRHFHRVGLDWQISDELRRMITFRRMNLAAPFPHVGTFDIIFLRNVLIYFDADTKRAVLRRIRSVLRPDGHLLLGSAETTIGVDDGWERMVVGRTSIHRPRVDAAVSAGTQRERVIDGCSRW